eukprot:TRINITY_DN35362_c0_g1_i2.p1 TRINITY_DN35362_c0_g1~~TRINITY_DN35362_c0_g1_i2.p1  ORF type:complete len:141 (-),score=1.45 TRINITY_DN35362_c0_g1_i2:1-390(-)
MLTSPNFYLFLKNPHRLPRFLVVQKKPKQKWKHRQQRESVGETQHSVKASGSVPLALKVAEEMPPQWYGSFPWTRKDSPQGRNQTGLSPKRLKVNAQVCSKTGALHVQRLSKEWLKDLTDYLPVREEIS